MGQGGATTKGQPGMAAAALFGLCPQCGAKGLFAGPARFAPCCRSCGLDFTSFNVGDGPAAFLIMVIGAVVVGLALWVEFAFAPPLWLHAVLWAPLITLATLGGLRITKAALLITEFQRKAREATGADLRQD
jgi:uncharacterized protein (DUF983 family)